MQNYFDKNETSLEF